jgi:Tfp pilus assembly protein PilZ
MSERRDLERFQHVEFVLYESPSVQGEGQLANASLTGLFIRTDELPKSGEVVRLELREGGAALILQGAVCWTSPEGIRSSSGFGVGLLHPAPALAELLRRRRKTLA